MTTIDSVQNVVAAIQTELADAMRRRRRAAGQRQTAQRTGSRDRMRELIGERIQALEPDDPERGRKAFRIFLESVLLSELGPALINDYQFYALVDRVEDAMATDPKWAPAIESAIAQLLANRAKGP